MLFAPLFLLIGAAQALPWDGANPTKHAELPLRYDEPPKPTEAVDLRKRQEIGDITCAWENGQASSCKRPTISFKYSLELGKLTTMESMSCTVQASMYARQTH
jgi:hypothetical protein